MIIKSQGIKPMSDENDEYISQTMVRAVRWLPVIDISDYDVSAFQQTLARTVINRILVHCVIDLRLGVMSRRLKFGLSNSLYTLAANADRSVI